MYTILPYEGVYCWDVFRLNISSEYISVAITFAGLNNQDQTKLESQIGLIPTHEWVT